MFTENFISTRLVKGKERVGKRKRKSSGLPYIITVCQASFVVFLID